MQSFRKRPVVVQAMQWNGPDDSVSLSRFAGHWASVGAEVFITTPEGSMKVSEGDWVIKGIKGEFYPCRPDIFAATYEPCEPTDADRLEEFNRFVSKLPDGQRSLALSIYTKVNPRYCEYRLGYGIVHMEFGKNREVHVSVCDPESRLGLGVMWMKNTLVLAETDDDSVPKEVQELIGTL